MPSRWQEDEPSSRRQTDEEEPLIQSQIPENGHKQHSTLLTVCPFILGSSQLLSLPVKVDLKLKCYCALRSMVTPKRTISWQSSKLKTGLLGVHYLEQLAISCRLLKRLCTGCKHGHCKAFYQVENWSLHITCIAH